MTDPLTGHTAHDPSLVARHAGGDLDGDDAALLARRLAGCPDCAVLDADLRMLAEATRRLPTPRRPRDFRLTAEDAARLRPHGWRRLVAALAGPRFELARPVGAGLASLGLAGLLLTALPGIPIGAGGGAAAPAAASPAAALPYDVRAQSGGDESSVPLEGAPAEGAPGATAGPAAGEAETDGGGRTDGGGDTSLNGTGAGPAGSPVAIAPESEREAPAPEREATARRTTDATLTVLSGSFLIVGLGLFGLHWTARRLGDG